MPPKGKNMVWTDVMKMVLMREAVKIGPHLGKNPTQKSDLWESLNEAFFNAPENVSIRPFHQTGKAANRKLREKFSKILKEVQQLKGWGNFYGGKTGNLSAEDSEEIENVGLNLVENCRQIIFDLEEISKKSVEAVEKKRKLEGIEDVWKKQKNQKNPLKTKAINGVVTDISVSNGSKQKRSWEDKLFDAFENTGTDGKIERDVEVAINRHIDAESITVDDLIHEAKISSNYEAVKRLLDDMSLQVYL